MSQKTHSDRIILGDKMNEADFASKSDEELMRSYQEGEQMAFEILFKRYAGRVLGFLSKRFFQPQLAQDLTQDVFLKLHRSRAQYVPDLVFAPWLFSITRSVWIDHLKKNRKEEPTEKEFLEKLSPATELVFESQDEILGYLPSNQKTAVAMKIYDDATFEEIASRLETSTANARQLFSRGLKRLREVTKLKRD
jgi:RNA polymerase sigma factor (sigma-70 family)